MSKLHYARKVLGLAAATGLSLLLFSTGASAHARVDWAVNVGAPIYAAAPVVYVAPRPRLVAVAPVVYVRPYGHSRQYWREREWQRRHWSQRHWHERHGYRHDYYGR
ncbi:hypothetical protein BH11PSE11_BH11PSE11_05090 [soil metagenome]